MKIKNDKLSESRLLEGEDTTGFSPKQWDVLEEAYKKVVSSWATVSKTSQFVDKNIKFLKGNKAYNEKEDMFLAISKGLYECFDTLEHLEYIMTRFAEDNGYLFEMPK